MRLYKVFKDFSEQMKKQNISVFASSTAYFFFLSLVPMIILICTIVPFTPITEDILLTVVRDLIPVKIGTLVERLINSIYQKSAGLLSVAAVVTLWSAGKGMMALIRGLNSVNNVQEKRNYFLIRMIASLYTAFMLLSVLISLIIVVFGNRLVHMVLYRIPKLEYLFGLLLHFRYLAIWVILTIFFAAIYAYVPNKKQHLREQIPGAAFSAMAWGIFCFGFSLYVDYADYSIYGSLAIIVLIMLWLYVCMYIILVGAYMNRYFKPINKVLTKRRKRG